MKGSTSDDRSILVLNCLNINLKCVLISSRLHFQFAIPFIAGCQGGATFVLLVETSTHHHRQLPRPPRLCLQLFLCLFIRFIDETSSLGDSLTFDPTKLVSFLNVRPLDGIQPHTRVEFENQFYTDRSRRLHAQCGPHLHFPLPSSPSSPSSLALLLRTRTTKWTTQHPTREY